MCKFGTLSIPKLGEEHCPYTHKDGKYHSKIIVCQHPEVTSFSILIEVLMPIVPELVHGAGLLQLPHGAVVAQRAHPRPIHRGGADVIGGDIVVDPAMKKH